MIIQNTPIDIMNRINNSYINNHDNIINNEKKFYDIRDEKVTEFYLKSELKNIQVSDERIE